MSAPIPAALIRSALLTRDRLAYEAELADGFESEPDVEPDWNDPDEPGYGGSDFWPEPDDYDPDAHYSAWV